MKTPGWIFLFSAWILLMAAVTIPLAASPSPPAADFGAYWYQGKAEITSYTLEQARYGEIHSGHAVLVYVTEDFSRGKQVKLDRPQAAGAEAVKILKKLARGPKGRSAYGKKTAEKVLKRCDIEVGAAAKPPAPEEEF